MNKYFKIFLLFWESAFESRSRSVVWFISSVVSPLILLLFWRGAFQNTHTIGGWTFSAFITYYLLLIIAGSMLVAHIEEDVAIHDIKDGNLSQYITKPISYFLYSLLSESPYRILQGSFGIIVIAVCLLLFPKMIVITSSFSVLFFAVVIAILGFCISFSFKMCLGLLAFWLTEIRSFLDLSEILLVVFGGFTVPIFLLPSLVKTFANILPFSYIVYYPVIAFLGKLSAYEELTIMGIQLIWFGILIIIYSLLWAHGLRKFSGVGQ